MNKNKVSIVIPTYNEEKDIENTLKNLFLFHNYVKEILVIDDSIDNTETIVRELSKKNKLLKYFKNPETGGRGEARNYGIKISTGDYVMILNADVSLSSNFFDIALKHFEDGHDIILSKSIIKNNDKNYSRYLELLISYDFLYNLNKIHWTEAFICKRSVFNDKSNYFFSENKKLKLSSGEDALFAKKIINKGFSYIIDTNLINIQTVPDNLKEFWLIRTNRGRGSAVYKNIVKNISIVKIILTTILRSILYFLEIFFFIPIFISSFYLIYKVEKKISFKDTFSILIPAAIEKISFIYGEIKGIKEIISQN